MTGESKSALLRSWDAYYHPLLAQTSTEGAVSPEQIPRHRRELEGDIEKWILFFFKNAAANPFAPFHKKYFRRILANPEWYEVLSWSRELSKSTCTMFVVLYLALTGRKKNILLISNSYDNAERLIEPWRAHLASNRLIDLYYGDQPVAGAWEAGEFRIRNGATFRACGALQSPRGAKSVDDARPDCIIFDDFDTDEEVRNPAIIARKWQWFEGAVYGARSVAGKCLVLWLGNIIATDCCITRAGKMADHWDVVNIRDAQGRSTWPEKNDEASIDRTLSKISARAAQQEYFNNPLSEGEVFQEMTWGKCPPLSRLPFVVSYCDPSPSSSDKQKLGASFKANVLMGYHEGRFYVYKCFLAQTTTAEMVEWPYLMRDYVAGRAQIFYAIENNTLQNPFYQQVYLPLFHTLGQTRGYIPVTPDERKKPDKAARIEGNLEPVSRQGLLVLNEAERGNPHMNRLEEQFKLFTPQLKAPADGPDCVEGAWYWLNERIRQSAFAPAAGRRKEPKNAY